VPDSLHDLPVVLVDAADAAAPVPSVVPDEERIGRDATEYLLDAGHRRIVHLTIDDRGPGHDGRIAGFRDTMRAHGLPAEISSVPGPADARAGFEAVRRAWSQDPPPSAVFCFNDEMALGVYQAAREVGIRVPEQLSIMSVDDFTPIAAQLRPGLTTMALPHYEMGRWAIRTILELIEASEPVEPVRMRLPAALVRRGSVAAPSDVAPSTGAPSAGAPSNGDADA
jgi:LacI family transcriptional regulator